MGKGRGLSTARILIVIAVVAGSVAAMTPVTINAVKKAQANTVAEKIMILAEGIREAALSNGFFIADFHGTEVKMIPGSSTKAQTWEDAISLSSIGGGRIDGSLYEALYRIRDQRIDVVIGFAGRVDIEPLRDIMPEVSERAPVSSGSVFVWEGGDYFPVIGCDPGQFPNIWYRFSVALN